jgi:hypothetical protein
MRHFLIVLSLFCLKANAQNFTKLQAEKSLKLYRDNLALLRQDHPNGRNLPDVKFFFFGMGDRPKMCYKDGSLINLETKKAARRWKVKEAIIVPSEYLVHLELENGKAVDIQETNTGLYIFENQMQVILAETKLNLPDFSEKKFGSILRVLHHEVLINIQDGMPFPNFLAFEKPWYRDAASMGMVMKTTGNTNLLTNWIVNLNEPFDRNNQGRAEVDNLGQVLFLVSLVSDVKHPIVEKVIEAREPFERENYIVGRTDGEQHPVYQTKWLKFGLKSLGLKDKYIVPSEPDSYSSIFWWDFKKDNVQGLRFDEAANLKNPYLAWAEDDFYNEKRALVSLRDYPLTWSSDNEFAKFENLNLIDPSFGEQKLTPTHGRHAAEMFMTLFNQK